MASSTFKNNLLKYGWINSDTGDMSLPGNLVCENLIVPGNVIANVIAILPPTASLDVTGNVTGSWIRTGQVNVSGNIVATNFIGNGAGLTGVTSTLPGVASLDVRGNVIGSYANVANVIATSGNIGNVILQGGNVTASFFFGNGAGLTGICYANVANVIATSGNIGNVTLAGGNITATTGNVGNVILQGGNVTASFFFGNGAGLTGISGSSNITGTVQSIDTRGNVIGNHANVTTVIATSGNVGNVTLSGGNVIAALFVGNGSQLTNIVDAALPAVITSDISGGNLTGTFANVTTVAATTGNVGNVILQGGNVTASFFFGNGAGLTGISGSSNITGTVQSIDTRGNVIGNYANVTAVIATTGNVGNVILQGGNVAASGQVNVLGNVVAPFFIGNGSQLTNTVTSFTANGTTITTSNLFLSTDQYLSAVPANSSGLSISVKGVNTGGNLVALTGSGYIPQINLNGYLVVPQGYVANTQVRLALSGGNAPIGTLVTQLDTGNSYLLTTSPSNINANWLTFTGTNFPVNTVFGRNGDVFATYGDYTDNFIPLTTSVGTVPAGNSVSEALQTLQSSKANIMNGNISASLFIGNISSAYGNVGNVFLFGGNVIASNFFGNGAGITNLPVGSDTVDTTSISGNIAPTTGFNMMTVGTGYVNRTLPSATSLSGTKLTVASSINSTGIANILLPSGSVFNQLCPGQGATFESDGTNWNTISTNPSVNQVTFTEAYAREDFTISPANTALNVTSITANIGLDPLNNWDRVNGNGYTCRANGIYQITIAGLFSGANAPPTRRSLGLNVGGNLIWVTSFGFPQVPDGGLANSIPTTGTLLTRLTTGTLVKPVAWSGAIGSLYGTNTSGVLYATWMSVAKIG